MDANGLAESAYQHIVEMVERIGPRPAGSVSEQKAFAYIKTRLEEWGYIVVETPVQFVEHLRFFPYYALGGIGLILASILIYRIAIVAIILPFFIAVLPQLGRWMFRRMKGNGQSTNIAAELKVGQLNTTLILCAHVDSGRANAIKSEKLLRLYGWSLFIAQRAAIFLAAIAFLRILNYSIPVLLVNIGILFGCIVGGFWIIIEVFSQIEQPVQFSPGAYDNASGVGVLLSLAEYFSQNPPRNTTLRFLFTGAEETGMHGAKAAASVLHPDDDLMVINLDMVGAGDRVRFVSREGVIFPLRTDGGLNALIKEAVPTAHSIWYTKKSGDYYEFVKKGIRTASIQMSGCVDAEFYYHTVADGMKTIQQPALKIVITAIYNIISLLEEQDFR